MIFVTDKGRLANNIFQYGQLYAWGREHGRTTMSMRFAYKYPDFRIAHTRYHNAFIYVLAKLAAKLHIIPTVVFDGEEHGQTETMLQHRHVLATGWSVRYPDLFEKYKTEIVQLFEFMPEVHRTVNHLLSHSTPSVVRLGVHIRRGDYSTWCGGRFYFNDQEYADAIRQFIELQKGKKVEVFICSNDPKLDTAIYQNQLPTATVHFPKGSATEDLCLLSKCDYIIGPVSTFTLIASMYHDTPLFWMADRCLQVTRESFHPFNYQARHYDKYFIAPESI